MNLAFTLHLDRVHCRSEQLHEPGKDEIRFLGFGLPRLGKAFFTGFKSLGSWSEGDDRSTGLFPLLLHQEELPQAGSEVLFYYWMVEEDTGGVGSAAGTFEATFRELYADQVRQLQTIDFPRECIPFTAFYKAIPKFQSTLESAAHHWINDDDLFSPRDFLVRYTPSGVSLLQPSVMRPSTTMSQTGGTYDLFFRATYTPIVVATS